ncbi:MAG: hypothetical protein QOE61_2528, partial [Micromonosporaceae bacterium]|nr:hypothetical protein [Micromonosporaceae bacterium]
MAALDEQTVVVPATAAAETVLPRLADALRDVLNRRTELAAQVEEILDTAHRYLQPALSAPSAGFRPGLALTPPQRMPTIGSIETVHEALPSTEDGTLMAMPDVVADLLDRSNRLGADRRNTNYAGGNTSAKGAAPDPVTGEPTDLMWVKGSGGDLGTLTGQGLAVLRLDRLRALAEVYPGEQREDEMVATFDYCLHGRGGAAPSIDTAMHGLIDAAHVDHLHPDSGIALATAANGKELTRQCFGDRVVWVPWRRPGFHLGLDIAAIASAHPDAIGCILGGHGITSW